MSIGLAVLSGLGLVVIVAVLAIVLMRRRRDAARQDRLDSAFRRAKLARRSGSGIQGQHYSPYWDRDPD